VDPLAKDYPWNSPYAFSENVVINAIELEGLERNYTFNSAYFSAEAKTIIQTQTFVEIKKYLDGLVGTKFSEYRFLKEAKEKLGTSFDGALSYSSSGDYQLPSGNLAVRGSSSYNNEPDYITARLVIDNGDGTWSTQNVKIFNPNSIKQKVNEVENEINSLQDNLEALNKTIKSDEIWINMSPGLINTSDKRDGVADALGNIGPEYVKHLTRQKLPGLKKEAKSMEKKIEKLKKHKEYLEKLDVEWGKVEKVKKVD
jgi:hypothetical protein